jgi:(E)-4-hydroxy-3-methylbut-2-enyl-diphosphate synthase
MQSAKALAAIKKNITIPLVADIHFDYKLALAAIDSGADKIRINPGNIGDKSAVAQVASAAKSAGIPIRIGVNGGSLEKDILEKYRGITPEALVESAMNNIELMESFGFGDLVVSIKTSDVKANYKAHKLLSTKTNYSLHIGITEAGVGQQAIIKSAIGIGSLLLEGIGDTIRVSLTGNPVNEVIAAKNILNSIGLNKNGSINVISCPTCGRTEVDLLNIATQVSNEVSKLEPNRIVSGKPSLNIAVMGCAVNGPGEAKSADFGVACGINKGIIFKDGEILKTVPEADITKELLNLIKK